MKKHLIIAGIICAASIPPAAAVTKCVALNSISTTCNVGYSFARLDWSTTCKTNGIYVPIVGIAGCSSKNGGTIGTTSDSIPTSSTSDDNKYCWCKMVSPAVSRWVYYGSLSSAGNCAYNCSGSCVQYAIEKASFRSALFAILSD